MPSNIYDVNNLGSAVSTKEQKYAGASLISPQSYPLYATTEKKTLKSTTQSWFLNDLEDPDITPVAEGTNPSNFADPNRFQGEVFNYSTTLERTGQLTDDYMLTEAYVENSLAESKKRKTIELMLDIEKKGFDLTARAAGSKGGAARNGEGLAGQLTADSSVFADAPEYVIPTAQEISASAPTETTVNDALKSVADESGDLADLIVYADSGWLHSFTKSVMRIQTSGVDDKVSVNINGAEAKVGLRLKVYEGISGMITLVMTNPKCSADTTNLDTALFVNRKNVCLGHLGPNISIKDEPERHGTREFSIRTKVMWMAKNPKSCVNWKSIA